MSMRIQIDDSGLELCVCVHASGGYSPDVMDDVTARALATYKEALAHKLSFGVELVSADEADDD